eukprot:gnl/TRDRNA2_/TRDRNA2_56787_c0_seq1.p1 gnl/TRDRNA2_/TRDRNA2_56787_c0~~gnl/TRDRNA2_/TRDRNA2_56787_c0_seq1.p1  ORF type:complete len:439 (-),score=66.36 gnl/TRDRNA2_/TRDRNA2_56787_c0_seq1:46-1362(-)
MATRPPCHQMSSTRAPMSGTWRIGCTSRHIAGHSLSNLQVHLRLPNYSSRRQVLRQAIGQMNVWISTEIACARQSFIEEMQEVSALSAALRASHERLSTKVEHLENSIDEHVHCSDSHVQVGRHAAQERPVEVAEVPTREIEEQTSLWSKFEALEGALSVSVTDVEVLKRLCNDLTDSIAIQEGELRGSADAIRRLEVQSTKSEEERLSFQAGLESKIESFEGFSRQSSGLAETVASCDMEFGRKSLDGITRLRARLKTVEEERRAFQAVNDADVKMLRRHYDDLADSISRHDVEIRRNTDATARLKKQLTMGFSTVKESVDCLFQTMESLKPGLNDRRGIASSKDTGATDIATLTAPKRVTDHVPSEEGAKQVDRMQLVAKEMLIREVSERLRAQSLPPVFDSKFADGRESIELTSLSRRTGDLAEAVSGMVRRVVG